MTAAEQKAKELLKGMRLNKLLELWETTTDNNDANIYRVRGWLMEELERRNPEAFNKWLEGDANDEELRNYITV